MINAIDYMLRKRKSTSPYLFCRKSNNTPLDGCSAMRTITDECPGLEKPERIRTREMRKYLATTSQILDMTAPELKMVADHMGHNIDVHTDVYRLQSSILEKTKVARVLIAVENGSVNRFQGKRLQDISINDIPDPISYDDDWQKTTHTDDVAGSTSGSGKTRRQMDGQREQELLGEGTSCNEAELLGEGSSCNEEDGYDGCSDMSDPPAAKRQRKNSGPSIKRLRWDATEKSRFREPLGACITNNTMPDGKALTEAATVLPDRTVAQIRTRMHNIISGKLVNY